MSFFGSYISESSENDDIEYIEELDSFPVLYIEEHDEDSNEQVKLFDNKIFVYYVDKTGYYITGKRRDTKKNISKPYSFVCKKSKEVLNFIRYIIGQNKYNVVLYNYTNMPHNDYNSATYDFMINNISKDYELCAYDNVSTLKQIKHGLRICKNIHNYVSDDESGDDSDSNENENSETDE